MELERTAPPEAAGPLEVDGRGAASEEPRTTEIARTRKGRTTIGRRDAGARIERSIDAAIGVSGAGMRSSAAASGGASFDAQQRRSQVKQPERSEEEPSARRSVRRSIVRMQARGSSGRSTRPSVCRVPGCGRLRRRRVGHRLMRSKDEAKLSNQKEVKMNRRHGGRYDDRSSECRRADRAVDRRGHRGVGCRDAVVGGGVRWGIADAQQGHLQRRLKVAAAPGATCRQATWERRRV